MKDFPQLRQRANGYWYIYYAAHEKESLKTKDRQVAKELYAQKLRQKRENEVVSLAPKTDTRLSVFIKEYLEWRETGDGRAPGTVKVDKVTLHSLFTFMGDKIMSRIRPRDIDAWHSWMRAPHTFSNYRRGRNMVGEQPFPGVKPSTRNGYTRVLNVAFRRALRWGYILANPLEDVKPIPQDDVEAAFLTRPDIEERLLPALEQYDTVFQNLVKMYLYTGCRRAELCRMRAEQVIEENGHIYLNIPKSKTHSRRMVPVPTDALALTEQLPKEGYLFPGYTRPGTVTNKVKKLLRKAGLGHLHLHSLRHTTASHLAVGGVSDKAKMLILGHKNPATLKRYEHLMPGYLEEAMDKLSFKARPQPTAPVLTVVKNKKYKTDQ